MSAHSEQLDEPALPPLRAPANDPQPVADRLAARLKAVVSPLHFAEFYHLWQDRLPKGPKYDPVEYTREAAALLREIHRTVEATDPIERLAALAALVDLREVPDGARTLDANTLSLLARHDGRMFAQVGMGTYIVHGARLPAGTLVLDGSRIDGTPEHARNLDEATAMIAEGRTPVVDDTEYLSRRADYDAKCIGPDGHRRFAVHVGCAEDSVLRFGRIAPKYAGAFLFARTHVVEDNMAFSRIDTLVGSLAHRLRVAGFPELSRFLVEEKAISYADPTAEIDGFLAEQSALGRDLSHARERLIRSAEASSVLLLARPRDNDGFFETGFVEIVDMLDREDSTEDGIHKLLLKHFYRPEIDRESRFYGRSVLSGRVRVERSVVADSKIRCDETGEEDEAVVSDAAMIATVVHGPRSKRIRGGAYRDGTIHNGTVAEDCEIGIESGSLPWVLNDAIARRVSARGGGIAVNAETIEDETLAPGTVRHAGRAFPATHPDEIAY